jgi:1,4-dihydroxy-6-naphthoate synthase
MRAWRAQYFEFLISNFEFSISFLLAPAERETYLLPIMPANKNLTLGHSPDPDDAFMFYALAEHKIDTRGYDFQHILQDIQTLNERCTRGELHISAISIHAYAYVLDRYALLPCGASMGDGYGPMVIASSRDGLTENPSDDQIRDWLRSRRVAVPGAMTSAFLALRLFLGEFDASQVPFDEIFKNVASGCSDAGLIIHEGQLTYSSEGFVKILDLGEWWRRETGLPLPLGGNVIRKDIPPAERSVISSILEQSIRYGLDHRAQAVAHSMPQARGMKIPMVDKFIGMYVNDYTLDYGDIGRRAIHEFLTRAHEAGIIPAPVKLEFVPLPT